MNITYKNILPDNLSVQINTKVLPTKGNLAYEYNPLKNYRLDSRKYLYNNKFYSEQELIQLNIFSEIIEINDGDQGFRILKYKSFIQKDDAINITFKGLQFKIPIINEGVNSNFTLVLPDKGLYFSEHKILNNKADSKIYCDEDGNLCVLTKENSQYIVGYDLAANAFWYGDTPLTSLDYTTIITKKNLEDIALTFSDYSLKYIHIVGSSEIILINEIIPFEKNSLVDFQTNELNFNLEHPVQILPLYSYDGSVNLIMTDGYAKPRLINTRFSTTGKNTYEIVDRKGNNDTNIYDAGGLFELDTSLYKQTSNIPKLILNEVYSGGVLQVGNYHFYFTYADSDKNETDFVCESGLVSIFIGNTAKSIRQGFRNENAFKGIRFTLLNIDPAYSYINIYYTKSTGDIHENAETQAYKLSLPVFITNTENLVINITGYEDVTEIPLSDINPIYQIIETAETLASNKNMLFLGNIQKQTPNYTELADLALHFGPVLDTSLEYLNLDQNYTNNFGGLDGTYYDPKYIYNNVGYWPEEIYRFGVVFILNDNTLTPVFNVRGINDLNEDVEYTTFKVNDLNQNRLYIEINENTKLIVKGKTSKLENSKGVVRLHSTKKDLTDSNFVYGIKFKILASDKNDFIQELKKHCKGYFFVRQKRIPTVLAEGLTIGIEKHGHHPCLPVSSSVIGTLENCKKVKKNTSVKLSDSDTFTKITSEKEVRCCPYINFKGSYGYLAESFLSMNRELVHEFEYHLRVIPNSQVDVEGMICPEYDINYDQLNSIFTGDECTLIKSAWQPKYKYLDANKSDRHFYPNGYQREIITTKDISTIKARILGVEDGSPAAGIEDSIYSGLAGEPNMGYKFDQLSGEQISTDTTNLVRGIWGPFVALKSEKNIQPCTIYTIMIPGYKESDMENYFTIRYNDKTSYYAVSERYELNNFDEDTVHYRGDCYICLFTHRMNRNFNDNSAPYNDKIVNRKTWKGENNGEPTGDEKEEDYKGFVVKDGVIKTKNFTHINLGDINAVKLGHWVTFQLRSSFNLNVRATDSSDVTETTVTGHGKGFYPYNPLNAGGTYKHQESLCVNKGFEKSVSERYNYEQPDIPAIKNQFKNRIIYSNPAASDSFKNGFRQFRGGDYQDYQTTYGEITKILDFKEGLFVVFEHGIGYLGINERALVANASSGNVYLNSAKVIPDDGNMTIISDCFGSLWKESIIKTPYGVYGVDTQAKKIWVYDASGFKCISDFRVLKFLNDNISLGERELTPIIGIRNVKTHYNRFKNDVMFTFYDTLENEQEKVWNLCYNENMRQFITFYSWVPSYSENIYNQYFSFDRNSSKWITKLGQTNTGNDFAQGIVFVKGNSVLPDDQLILNGETIFGTLGLHNIQYQEIIKFELLHDNFGNHNLFKITNDNKLATTKHIKEYIAELYYREGGKDKNDSTEIDLELEETIDESEVVEEKQSTKSIIYARGDAKNNYTPLDDSIEVINLDQHIEANPKDLNLLLSPIRASSYYPIVTNSDGTRKELPYPVNKDKLVYILKVKCTYKNLQGVTKEFTDNIAVTLQYNLQFLTTDFWKHGQAGIIDIAEKIKPTHWYGKQHPFELEFVVAKEAYTLKVFDNLIIISNNAEPESFHYEITGDCYEFSEDKPNMYYRQEATEAFYQYNGLDIEYDPEFYTMKDDLNHKHLYKIKEELYEDISDTEYTKSTLLPLYYSRTNTANEVEDYYKLKTTENKNYDALSGAEITYDGIDYKIWQHAKGVNIKGPGGRLRGNMDYLEDRWVVQINPLNLVLKNESKWTNGVPPIVIANSPIPTTNKELEQLNVKLSEFPPILLNEGYKGKANLDKTSWGEIHQTKLRDKYMRVRIRYSGKKLAIILAVITLFRTSYA